MSYGRGTVDGLEELKSHLESAGYTVWLDRLDMSGGSDWQHCYWWSSYKLSLSSGPHQYQVHYLSALQE